MVIAVAMLTVKAAPIEISEAASLEAEVAPVAVDATAEDTLVTLETRACRCKLQDCSRFPAPGQSSCLRKAKNQFDSCLAKCSH